MSPSVVVVGSHPNSTVIILAVSEIERAANRVDAEVELEPARLLRHR